MEIDIVSNDVKKFFGSFRNRTGYAPEPTCNPSQRRSD